MELNVFETQLIKAQTIYLALIFFSSGCSLVFGFGRTTGFLDVFVGDPLLTDELEFQCIQTTRKVEFVISRVHITQYNDARRDKTFSEVANIFRCKLCRYTQVHLYKCSLYALRCQLSALHA